MPILRLMSRRPFALYDCSMRVLFLLGLLLIITVTYTSRVQALDAPILTCGVDNSNPTVGTDTAIRCSLQSATGAPFPGSEVVFMFTFESGTDALFDGANKAEVKATDGTGQLTTMLSTGDRPGVLGVLVNYASARSSFHVITVEPAPPID
jgi:hypothetical protein